MSIKQLSQSFLSSGHPTCQSCSVARPLQRKGWLDCRLQHTEESSSLKYLGSEFNLKGAEALSSHSRCTAVSRMARRQCDVHFSICFNFAVFFFLSPPYIILPCCFSLIHYICHHPPSVYLLLCLLKDDAGWG